MDPDAIKQRMQKSVDALVRDLARIRTGVASPAMLDSVKVDYYGTPTPVTHVATVTVPEPRTLSIQPFEPNLLEAIDKALLASDLGITPQNDGKVLRLTLPILTSERRQELAKKVRAVGEEAKISVRNIRRDENEHLKKEAKDEGLSEDDLKEFLKEIQDLTDSFIHKMDAIISDKEKDITSV